MARLRVHIFLSGLDSEYTQIRGEILPKDPKLVLENAYAYVRREFQQRQTIGNTNLNLESLAMLANQTRQGCLGGPSKNNFRQPSKGLVCIHCAETSNSKQKCYKIIGYPEWWDSTKKPRKNTAGKAMIASTMEELM